MKGAATQNDKKEPHNLSQLGGNRGRLHVSIASSMASETEVVLYLSRCRTHTCMVENRVSDSDCEQTATINMKAITEFLQHTLLQMQR